MIYLHLDDVMENRRKQLKGERHEHNISLFFCSTIIHCGGNATYVLLYFTFYFNINNFQHWFEYLNFYFHLKTVKVLNSMKRGDSKPVDTAFFHMSQLKEDFSF